MRKDGLRRLYPYLKRYKKILLLGFLFVTISNICSTYVPRVVGQTVDYLKEENYNMEDTFARIGLILLLTLGSGLFMYLTRRTIIYSSRYIEYDLRRDLLLSMQSQDIDYFNRNSVGSLMAHATNDIPAAREFIGPAIMYGANTITTFIFALYFMLSINVELTLISMAPIPLIAIGTYILGRKIHVSFMSVQDQFGTLTTLSQETFSGIRIIRAYVREVSEAIKFEDASKSYMKKYLNLAFSQSLIMPLVTALVGVSQIIVLGYGGFKIINNQLSLGELTQFFIYINLLIWPAAAIGWITNIIQRASASSIRLGNLFDQMPSVVEGDVAGHDVKSIRGDIIFDKVNLKYKYSTHYSLNNVNLHIPENSILGIVGGVGSGKTSLIKLLPRLYDVTDGEIIINGKDIKKYPLNTLRHNIGIVTQEPFLFSLTIKENIRFGKQDATDEEVLKAAKLAQLHEEVLLFPDGYDTMLGERGITLSGGQKQRVAIARAFIKDPEILILDDALSAVDSRTENLLLASLKEIMKNRITIIISHRISSVMHSDNIIVLENGFIKEEGNHAQLMDVKGIYFDMYDRQKLEQEIQNL